MPIEHSEAIVIRTIDFSETSLVLTLFTRRFGKVRGIAKGARQMKNSFDSALDLLTRISVSLIRKNSDALDLLTEAKLIHRFQVGTSGISGLYAGYFLAELLQMTQEDGEAMPELYDLTVETLSRLEEGRCVEEHLYRFPWNLMALLGERLSTDRCVVCGRRIDYGTEIHRGGGSVFRFSTAVRSAPNVDGHADSDSSPWLTPARWSGSIVSTRRPPPLFPTRKASAVKYEA